MADEVDLSQPLPEYGLASRPRRAHEFVAHELLVLVLSGRFQPGQRIPSERALAVELGVSRPTVRQAVAELAARGLLESRVGSGTFVVAPTAYEPGVANEATAREVMEARIVLEVSGVRLAARRARRGGDELLTLAAAVEALHRAPKPGRFPADLDVAFHRSVVELGGNALLQTLMTPCWGAVTSVVAPALAERWLPDDTERMAVQHAAVLAALRTADAELAAFEMERHLRGELTMLTSGTEREPPSRFFA